MYDAKYLTRRLLIEFNQAARREKRNRYIDENFLDSLPERNYPVQFVMYHSKDEIRTMIIFDEKGTFAFLDMSSERYDSIPIALPTADGNLITQSEDDIRKTLPYGGIEWIENKVKKAYRGKQSSFRRKVLSAYNSTCAICEQKSSLRAAHIKDKANGGSDEIENGICLCANHEIAFDQGILKIKPDGTVCSLIEDKTITVISIKLPNNKENYPSKELLQWKYDNS